MIWTGVIIDLPHDWSIEGKIDPKNPTGNAGGFFPTGIGWYRKSFKVPAEWKTMKVSIYFEGVYMNSEVFINGKSLGVYPYGYSSFSYDLTPYLEPGKENVIAVRVDNSQQVNCRWYSGSGIYRHVWMIVTDPVHVAQWGVGITTPDVSSEKATVQVKTLVKNETASPQNIVLKPCLLMPIIKGPGIIKRKWNFCKQRKKVLPKPLVFQTLSLVARNAGFISGPGSNCKRQSSN